MPGKWDTSLKRLLGTKPQDFIAWLLPGAIFKRAVTSNMSTRELEVDNLYEIILNGKDCLLHIEFQSYYDSTMAERMWKYNAQSTISYDLPVYSVVIYLKKSSVPEPYYIGDFPNGEEVHRFHFRVITLWKIELDVLKQTGLVGLVPLMVLAKDGKRPEVVEEAIRSIESTGGEAASTLLSLTYILASFVFEADADRKWLRRRFTVLQDVLRDAWAYQEIMQEGHEEGIRQGREEGVRQGREEERQKELQRQSQMLMTFIQVHFPSITELAQQQADAIKDPEVLQRLILQILAAQTEKQVQHILLGTTSKKKRQKKGQ